MIVIRRENVHRMIPELMYQLIAQGEVRDSRNGSVGKLPDPCSLVYLNPTERVEYWSVRDANPTFHLLESMWMLAGRNDVAFPTTIVSTFGQFSDDGETFNAAYGYRWREWYGRDQLVAIIEALRANPDCRRQVLAIWDGRHDLGLDSKDLPCNTQAYFSVNNGKLDMMVTNRSNDAVWGATGANAVHFSVLQEFMALAIGVKVGRYWQVSNNMHFYADRHLTMVEELASYAELAGGGMPTEYIDYGPYCIGDMKNPYLKDVHATPLFAGDTYEQFLDEVQNTINYLMGGAPRYLPEIPFLRNIVIPIYEVYQEWKAEKGTADRHTNAIRRISERCPTKNDWALACQRWYMRKQKKGAAE